MTHSIGQEAAMKIAVLDDYQDVFRTLKCAAKLKGHDVVAYRDTVKDPAKLAERLNGADAVILLQQRTPFPRAAAEKVTTLKLISQTGRNVNHIDMAACTEKGIVVCGSGAGLPNHTAELTWGLIFSSLRHIPQEVQRFKAGQWQTTLGTTVVGKTLGVYAYGRIGSIVAKVGRAFGMKRRLLGARRLDRAGARGRLRGRGEPRGVLRECGHREPAHPAQQGDARHRQACRPRAHEADRADRQHQPRADHRGRRAGEGAEGRAARASARWTSTRASRC